ncbi:PEP-CTERM sorting domain-containing protein [Botrimarina hoheduenensis]|nr:PEP-CTERM sorting domain-containing protein [Botrimarina hoheduenensis]
MLLVATNSVYAHSDVLVRDVAGKVAIGAAADLGMEEGGPFFDLETKVFEAVFYNPAAASPPFFYDFERDEPGFFSAPSVPVGTTLPGSADLTLSLEAFSLGGAHDTTFFWDGSGTVDFQPLAAAQPGVAFTFAPAQFATTDVFGAVDDHPLFGLTGGAANGVYLSRMRLDVTGLATSDPFYMVWLAHDALVSEDLAEELEGALEAFEEGGPAPVVAGVDFSFYEEAVEFAEGVPEPSSGLLVVLALSALAGISRR